MAVPLTNIRLSADVAAELGFATSSLMKMSDLYATSVLANQVSSGSYHNYLMGSGAFANTFANLIHGPYNSGTDMRLEAWAGYNHQHNNTINMNFTNNSPCDYDINLYLSSAPATFQNFFLAVSLPGGGTGVNYTDFDTGFNAYNQFGTPALSYYIDCEITFTGGPSTIPVNMFINGASDVDNVGATGSSTRTDFTNHSPTPGGYLLKPLGSDFKDALICGSTWATNGIDWNKRTSFDMMIM